MKNIYSAAVDLLAKKTQNSKSWADGQLANFVENIGNYQTADEIVSDYLSVYPNE